MTTLLQLLRFWVFHPNIHTEAAQQIFLLLNQLQLANLANFLSGHPEPPLSTGGDRLVKVRVEGNDLRAAAIRGPASLRDLIPFTTP